MFSAILGLIGGGISAAVSMRAADQQAQLGWEQLRLQNRALNTQNDMSMMAWQTAQEQLRREREREDYVRKIDAENRSFLRDEYDVRLKSQQERSRLANAERQFMINRQMEMDREAAELQKRGLEEYLKNRNLAAEERQYAMNLLEQTRRVAEGEAEEDLRRYAEERVIAQQERDFAISEMQRAQGIASAERIQDQALRDRIIGQADFLRSSLEATRAALGDIEAAPRVTREMIDAEIASRTDLALADADRAVTRASSANEADLIRRGLDGASVGAARRADVAERSALLYQQAREEARNAALGYISGVNDNLMRGFEASMGRRNAALQEAAQVGSVGMEALLRLPQMRSANDYNAPVAIGSSLFSRTTRSANDWRAPLDLGSAIYQSELGFMPGMANTLNLPSAAAAAELNAGSRLNPAASWDITSPLGYTQTAMEGQNAIQAARGGIAQSAFARSDQHMQSAGAGFGMALRALGGGLDNWMASNREASPQGRAQQFNAPPAAAAPAPTQWSGVWNAGPSFPMPRPRPSFDAYDPWRNTTMWGGPR